MNIEIKPITRTATHLSLDIAIVNSPIDNVAKASITYRLYGSSVHETGYLLIEGAEYDAWGTDDNYIVDLVCQKIGVERA